MSDRLTIHLPQMPEGGILHLDLRGRLDDEGACRGCAGFAELAKGD